MNFIDNMVLRTKLMLLSAVMLVGLLVVSFIGMHSATQWQKQVNQLGETNIPSLLGLMDMRAGSARIILQQYRIRGLKDDPQRVSKTADALEQIEKSWELRNKGYERYLAVPHGEDEKAEFAKLEDNFAKWQSVAERMQKECIEPLTRTSDPLAIDALYAKLNTLVLQALPSSKLLAAKC